MPSKPAAVSKRTIAADDKASGRAVAKADGKDSARRSRIYSRSDSPGARSYADVLSSPSPPPIRRRAAVPVSDAEDSNVDIRGHRDNHVSKVDVEASEDSSVVEIAGPRRLNPAARTRIHKRFSRRRNGSVSSAAIDLDMSDAELIPEASKPRPRIRKTLKTPERRRSVDAYEEDSFVELDASDASEIRKAVRHARRVLGRGPRYQSNIDSSPSPPSRSKAENDDKHKIQQNSSSRPRIPSGVKSSPIQTRASHGIFKRKHRPDAATFSEEERALNVTPKKRRSSGKAKPVPSRLSPVPSHLSDDTTPPPIFEALRDILGKAAPASAAPGESYRSVADPSSPAGPSAEPAPPTSPSLSPEKLFDMQPISISPLKIGDLGPSPEIPSPENSEAKARRYALFEESLKNKLAFEVPRGRTLQRGHRRRRSSLSVDIYISGEHESSHSRQDRGDVKRAARRALLRNDRHGKRRRYVSPDWDMVDDSDFPSTPKNQGKRRASKHIRSPSRPPATHKDKGKKRDLRTDITPPPPRELTRDEINREARRLLAACKASRLQREAELRQAIEDAQAGPSVAATGSESQPADTASGSATASSQPSDLVAEASGVPATTSSRTSNLPATPPPQTPDLPVTTPAQPTNASNQPIDPSWIIDFQSLHSTCVDALPPTCQVTVRGLGDPALSDDYARLPPLSYGVLISWKNTPGVGLITFSGWPEQTPSIDMSMLTAAIRFSKHEHFVNASRDSPLNTFVYNPHGVGSGEKGTIYAKLSSLQPTMPDGPKEVALLHKSRMAIFLSTILVAESQIMTPSLNGIKNKFVKGPLHRQEFERLAAYMCMLFKQPELVAQLDSSHNLTFGTMGTKETKSGDSDPSKSKQASSHIRSKALLKSVQPATHHRFSRSHTKAVLDATDTVPVYSAVGQNFRFSDDIATFDQLPRHPGEVPLGSCAVVGYTASLYKNSKSQLALATNLQFVVILAVE